jgi:butyryl-CoA dehydrogenase
VAVERIFLDIIHMALMTDSTRFITLHITGNNVQGIEGVDEAYHNLSHHGMDEATRRENMLVYEVLVPVVKGWSTEMSIEVASLGVQVHGGMGFIEETGAAQYYRDARILTIYEGTTAIQANDLVGRKTLRDGGSVIRGLLAQVRETAASLVGASDGDLVAIGRRLADAAGALEDAVAFVVSAGKTDPRAVYAGSVPYLKLAGIVLSGWQMGRAALVARGLLDAGAADEAFLRAKIGTARFHADHILTLSQGLSASITDGSAGVLALDALQY